MTKKQKPKKAAAKRATPRKAAKRRGRVANKTARPRAIKKRTIRNHPREHADKVRPARKNPEQSQAAAAGLMYKRFHGKPSTGSHVVAVKRYTPGDVAALGKVIELEVDAPKGRMMLKPSGVTLACSPDGGQLYFLGGDQAAPLDKLGVKGLPKNHVEIGALRRLVYLTRKGFHNFEPIEYTHRMGELGGVEPLLCYDTKSKLLYLVGGSYKVEPRGIVH